MVIVALLIIGCLVFAVLHHRHGEKQKSLEVAQWADNRRGHGVVNPLYMVPTDDGSTVTVIQDPYRVAGASNDVGLYDVVDPNDDTYGEVDGIDDACNGYLDVGDYDHIALSAQETTIYDLSQRQNSSGFTRGTSFKIPTDDGSFVVAHQEAGAGGEQDGEYVVVTGAGAEYAEIAPAHTDMNPDSVPYDTVVSEETPTDDAEELLANLGLGHAPVPAPANIAVDEPTVEDGGPPAGFADTTGDAHDYANVESVPDNELLAVGNELTVPSPTTKNQDDNDFGAVDAAAAAGPIPTMSFRKPKPATSTMSVCSHMSAAGKMCAFKPAGLSRFCSNHTCTLGGCLNNKSSGQTVCDQHSIGSIDLYGHQTVTPGVPDELSGFSDAEGPPPPLPPKTTGQDGEYLLVPGKAEAPHSDVAPASDYDVGPSAARSTAAYDLSPYDDPDPCQAEPYARNPQYAQAAMFGGGSGPDGQDGVPYDTAGPIDPAPNAAVYDVASAEAHFSEWQ